jgi:hypothetical protein
LEKEADTLAKLVDGVALHNMGVPELLERFSLGAEPLVLIKVSGHLQHVLGAVGLAADEERNGCGSTPDALYHLKAVVELGTRFRVAWVLGVLRAGSGDVFLETGQQLKELVHTLGAV